MRIGRNARLYYNSGSYGTPTWTEILHIEKDNFSNESEDVDVSDRNEDYKLHEPGQIDSGVEGTLIYRGDDDSWAFFEDAQISREEVDLLLLDDAVTVDAAPGWRLACKVHKASRPDRVKNEPHKLDFKVMPCPSDNQTGPEQFTVALSP